jgi:hypothetical protein
MHRQAILRTLGWALIAFTTAFATAVQAAANVQSMRGDVRANNMQLHPNDRLTAGASIITGAGAQAVLKFDDGQTVVLNENTTFTITDFRYRQAEPRNDRAIFDLIRGALRVISGAVAARNQDAFQLRIPQATIGIRGTDFMVAIVNPAFTSVGAGAISVSNGGGTTVFGAGSYGTVASTSSLAASIPASAVPSGASAAFSSMSAVPGVVGGGMSAGPSAAGAAAPGAGILPTAAAIGLAVGAVAGVSSDEATTTTHHAP